MTAPGPLNWLQNVLTVAPAGKPSSATVPFSCAVLGRVIVWFGPALTIGACVCWQHRYRHFITGRVFGVVDVSRNTYSPGRVKVASVTGELGLVKATSPGPLTLDHVSDSEQPRGKPSSQAVTAQFRYVRQRDCLIATGKCRRPGSFCTTGNV